MIGTLLQGVSRMPLTIRTMLTACAVMILAGCSVFERGSDELPPPPPGSIITTVTSTPQERRLEQQSDLGDDVVDPTN